MSDVNLPPGTLVWVGPTDHPEFVDAFHFCQQNAAQIAVRRDVAELIARPAGYVKQIIVARQDRSPASVEFMELIAGYPDADILGLTAAVCDGEARTGAPWAGLRQIRFCRWAAEIPDRLRRCGFVTPPVRPIRSILFLADRFEIAEPYLDYASSTRIAITWQRLIASPASREFDLVIWDDSIATPTSAGQWSERIVIRDPRVAAKHRWLRLQPQAVEIRSALVGGINDVVSKPCSIADAIA